MRCSCNLWRGTHRIADCDRGTSINRDTQLSLEGLKTPDGHYFGEKYSVLYSPGLWMEQLLRSPAQSGRADSLFLLMQRILLIRTIFPGWQPKGPSLQRPSANQGWWMLRAPTG